MLQWDEKNSNKKNLLNWKLKIFVFCRSYTDCGKKAM